MNKLPYENINLSKETYKLISEASFALGELNMLLKSSKNIDVFLNIFSLIEAKESSQTENIYSNLDTLLNDEIKENKSRNSCKVLGNKIAIIDGFNILKDTHELSLDLINYIHHEIEKDAKSIRDIPGTVIKNTSTNEILHVPPQDYFEIKDLLDNLFDYINKDDELDFISKLAIIHYQFESIHPYFDGNGRTGRVLCLLYLVNAKKLDYPILLLSRTINKNLYDYYDMFSNMRNENPDFDFLVSYFAKVLLEASRHTIKAINELNLMMNETREIILNIDIKIYFDNITNFIFKHNYLTNKDLCNELKISRNTASKILKTLVSLNVFSEKKVGKEIIYRNLKIEDYIYIF